MNDLFSSTDSYHLFAEVILPLPLPKTFTYRVPRDWQEVIEEGKRVLVQFGKKKILTGIISEIHEIPPSDYEAKPILEVLDEVPTLNLLQRRLFSWMAEYYMAMPGDILQASLPAGLKLSSESKLQLHPYFNRNDSAQSFTAKEELVLDALDNNKLLGYSDVEKLLQQKNFFTLIKSLVDKEAVLLLEEVYDSYRPKVQKRVRLREKFLLEEALKNLMDTLEKYPKQLEILLFYLSEKPVNTLTEDNAEGIVKASLKPFSVSALSTLIKKGVFETFEKVVPRFEFQENPAETTIELSDLQEDARQQILSFFEKKNVVLLHGITGSGKTEIYIRLIQDAISNEQQVLYLLPEIALTTQIVQRLLKVFGAKMGIYHSRFSDNERVEIWRGVQSGQYQVVVGVRSSIFLPFDNLGLIIVDEEHETSYKQYDPAPRYHARDVAIWLGQTHHAKVLLGSATPSVESYHAALEGRYGLVELLHRYQEAVLPRIHLVDMHQARDRKKIKGHFSNELIDRLNETLNRKEQAILFQNRRGFAPFILCQDCSWIPKCQNCAVSLTYHMYDNRLSCHYCGYTIAQPDQCPSCGGNDLKTMGFGTEKLEDDLNILIPEARIQRLDLDTTRRKHAYQDIIDNFARGSIDILIGTQMVTKGLDFDRVTLVGVMEADPMIHFPDFRSHERAFHTLTQVSGRAGRREAQGNVLIQTYNPHQEILQDVIHQDYKAFFRKEITQRERFLYPPFHRLIKIIFKHTEKDICEQASHAYHRLLAAHFGEQLLLGPQEGLIARIKNAYIFDIVLKVPKAANLSKVKLFLSKSAQEVQREKDYRKLQIVFDVDPY